MSATKGLALPEGTEVRMTCDHDSFDEGDIVVRELRGGDDESGVAFDNGKYWHYLQDYEWELIKESSAEGLIQIPKQGDKIQVRFTEGDESFWADGEFVCFYKRDVIAFNQCGFDVYNDWRFPPQEEVTLSDGKTYLVEERDGEKVLKLKN